jgi:hypothetical protein
MNMVGNLGTFFTPPIVAALAETKVDGRTVFHWHWAVLYSALMFFLASVCWLFINPKRVIVYKPDDRARLRAEGVLA